MSAAEHSVLSAAPRLALARTWRPRTLTELVGQEHVVRALTHALERGQLHHAYLFTGTRGVGKTTLARILAKALNCERGVSATPCGQCTSCVEIDGGRFVDLLEIDAASRTKVDQTRELLDNVPFAPVRGRYKVYLIDEVHMFSTSSFNALLKTLEEPPPHVKFILATTDPQKVPPTVLSRCLQFHLKHLPEQAIQARLRQILIAEGVAHEEPALALLARAAAGSMRDALSLLDQALAYGGGALALSDVRAMLGTVDRDLVFNLAEALAANDGARLLREIARVAELTPDFAGMLRELIDLLHRVALIQQIPETLAPDDPERARWQALAAAIAPEDVQLYYQIALLGQQDLALAPSPRAGFEMVLLRALAFRPDPEPETAGQVGAAPAPVAVRSTVPPAAGPGLAPASARELPRTEDDWHRLVARLSLAGLEGELAKHCAFRASEGDTLQLALAPAAQPLRGVGERRLTEALSAALGRPVRLVFQVAAPTADTPAFRQVTRDRERRSAAEALLRDDPVAQTLIERCQATWVPDSIRAEEDLPPAESA